MRRAAFGMSAIVTATAACAAGQVIQLPSFHSFSVDTTVVVPDRGAAPLAGNRRAAEGRRHLGPGASRGTGLRRQAGGTAATAQIHDPRAAEAARAARAKTGGGADARPLDLIPAKAADDAAGGVRRAEAQRAAELAQRKESARALEQRARRAEADGKPNVAAIFRRRAARWSSEDAPAAAASGPAERTR